MQISKTVTVQTLEQVYKKVVGINQKTNMLIRKEENSLSENEKNNIILDTILEFQGKVGKLNDSYIKLIESLEEIFKVDSRDVSADDKILLRNLISELESLNRKATNFHISLNKIDSIKSGCKSDLFDFRINIRNLKEVIADIRDVFISKSYHNNEKLRNLLSSF